MTPAQGSQAEPSSLASEERRQNEMKFRHCGSFSASPNQVFLTGPEMQDEDRLMTIRSTAVALQKVSRV